MIDQYRRVRELADARLGLRRVVRSDVQLDDQAEVGSLLPEGAHALGVERIEVLLLAAVSVETERDDFGMLLDQRLELDRRFGIFGVVERRAAQAVRLALEAVEHEA